MAYRLRTGSEFCLSFSAATRPCFLPHNSLCAGHAADSAFLALGGRGLDTALTYGDPTQEKVAAAIKATDVPRDEIFLTTKVPCCPRQFDGKPLAYCQKPEFSGSITKDVEEDVKILGKIDLLLLHWPCDTVEETMAAWTQLEAALDAGHTRAIGISNANASLLAEMLPKMKAKPSVNQCGHSIGAHNSRCALYLKPAKLSHD